MKERAPRFGVILPARARWGGAWVAATVRNVSERGLMLRTPNPPAPGTYVELQFGGMLVMARSVWTRGDTCGLKSQDRLNISALRGTPVPAGGPATARTPVASQGARRASARELAERSQRMSSLFQYLTFAAIAVAVAGTLGVEVFHTLSAPMNVIESKMKQDTP